MTARDDIFAEPHVDLVDFAFDAGVAAVFPDMVRRSVPAYDTVVPLSALIAKRHLEAGDVCYDLGCSLGATTLAVLRQIGALEVRMNAVDNATAMLAAAARVLDDPRVRLVCQDLRNVPITDAGAVLMNYTLQFVPVEDRLAVLRRVAEGLNRHGVLVVSEKIASDDYDATMHLEFKRANGYSELEISQKRAALEAVMVPETIDAHVDRLHAAGFREVRVWFRCFNWASFIALP